jgi:site-specific recombinase XerD
MRIMRAQQLARPIDFYLELGRDAIRESKAKRTREAYAHDWKLFRLWCERHHEIPLPASPTTVVAYLGAMAEGGKKTSSMARHLVSIGTAHKAANLDLTTSHLAVRSAMQGYKRLLGTAKTKKTAMRKADLVRIFAGMDDDVDHALNVRDRAVLLLGLSGAFRRSELAALRVEDVRFTEEGMAVHLVRSKTDQFAQDRDVGILRGGCHYVEPR